MDAREQTFKEHETTLKEVENRHRAKEQQLELRLVALEEMQQYNTRVAEKCIPSSMRCC